MQIYILEKPGTVQCAVYGFALPCFDMSVESPNICKRIVYDGKQKQ